MALEETVSGYLFELDEPKNSIKVIKIEYEFESRICTLRTKLEGVKPLEEHLNMCFMENIKNREKIKKERKRVKGKYIARWKKSVQI